MNQTTTFNKGILGLKYSSRWKTHKEEDTDDSAIFSQFSYQKKKSLRRPMPSRRREPAAAAKEKHAGDVVLWSSAGRSSPWGSPVL